MGTRCAMSESCTLLYVEDDHVAAHELAAELQAQIQEIKVRSFPDGESLVQVGACSKAVVVYRSLHQPNAKLVDLILAASAARDQGAEMLVLVAPYLPYMRQDIAFHAGEAVSQRVIGRLLGDIFDAVISVDPHLHRTRDLGDVFPDTHVKALSAAVYVGKEISKNTSMRDVVLLGPDEESEPWVKAAAEAAGCSWAVGRKTRYGDRQVEVELPQTADLSGQHVIVFDDVISSGSTICKCAVAAIQRGAEAVSVYVTHALFTPQDGRAMLAAGVGKIVSCDGVPHETNGIRLAPLVAEAVVECL